MNEQDYAQITAACDRMLRAADTSVERIAIPALHVINEHPASIAPYASILRPASAEPKATPASPLRTPVRVVRALLRSALAAPPLLPLLPERERAVDALIVSHVGNRALLGVSDDFYFGAMQRLLLDRGATSALVLVNHLYDEDPRYSRVIRPFPAARVLLPRTVTSGVEAGIWRRCWTARAQLRHAARSTDAPVDRAVALIASRRALSSDTAANLRLLAHVSGICALLKPRIVMTPYEGDAAERMVWLAARHAGRRPLCVGYQHTRVLPRAHALRRSLQIPGIDCDPDVILTLGEIPHAMLGASPGLGPVRLITYGSHRRAALGDTVPWSERGQLCLVLPDGDARERTILFEFAVACARRIPELMFALRPHPGFDPAALQTGSRVSRGGLPANVTISTGRTLAEDCARARYCLYRGSSAAMHAVLAGVKPFYLTRTAELTFDPLFALSEWRKIVTTPEEFSALVRSGDGSVIAARQAWSWCDRYISAVRPAALDELLSLI